MRQMTLEQALKYNSNELGYVVSPQNEEEIIAICRAKSVIELLQNEIRNIKID
jgi:hypothetical protein